MPDIWPRDEQMFWAPPSVNEFNLASGAIDIPPDYFRTTLIVTGDGANTIKLSWFNNGISAVVVTLSPQNAYVILTYSQVGPLVFQEFHVAGPVAATGSWTAMGRNKDPRDYGYPEAYMHRGTVPDRAPPSLRRKQRLQRVQPLRRSGIYQRISSRHPELFDG